MEPVEEGSAASHSSRWWLQLLPFVPRLVTLGLAGAPLLVLYWIFWTRLGYGADLEWMEGAVLVHGKRVMDGQPLYGPPTADFASFLYTPLYPWLLAAFGKVFGLSYTLGRALSILAFTATLGFVVRACLRAGVEPPPPPSSADPSAPARHRLSLHSHSLHSLSLRSLSLRPLSLHSVSWDALAFAAVALGVVAAAYDFTGGWYDLVRGDTLQVALSAGGLYVLGVHGRGLRGTLVAGLLLGLGFLAKQTAVFPILAAGLAMPFVRLRLLPVLVLVVGVVAGLGTLLLNHLSDGWLWFYVYDLHQAHRTDPTQLWPKVPTLLWGHARWLYLGCLSAIALWIFAAVWRRRILPQGPVWLFAALAGIAAAAVGRATQWSHENAYIPGILFPAAFLAIASAEARALLNAPLAGARALFDAPHAEARALLNAPLAEARALLDAPTTGARVPLDAPHAEARAPLDAPHAEARAPLDAPLDALSPLGGWRAWLLGRAWLRASLPWAPVALGLIHLAVTPLPDRRRHVPDARAYAQASELRRLLVRLGRQGELYVPYHPFYCVLSGGPGHGHVMNVNDVDVTRPPKEDHKGLLGDAAARRRRVLSARRGLLQSLRDQLASGRFAAVIHDRAVISRWRQAGVQAVPVVDFRFAAQVPGLLTYYRFERDLVWDRASPPMRTGNLCAPRYLWVRIGPARPPAGSRVVFDFEKGGLERWTVTGTAFGSGPVSGLLWDPRRRQAQGLVAGAGGRRWLSSFHGGDAATGRLRSPLFRLDRPSLWLRVGGGRDAAKLRVSLLVKGRAVATATGEQSEQFRTVRWDVRAHLGEEAELEVVDEATGSWGHLQLDEVWLVPAEARPGS